jgi:hypothetical protein
MPESMRWRWHHISKLQWSRASRLPEVSVLHHRRNEQMKNHPPVIPPRFIEQSVAPKCVKPYCNRPREWSKKLGRLGTLCSHHAEKQRERSRRRRQTSQVGDGVRSTPAVGPEERFDSYNPSRICLDGQPCKRPGECLARGKCHVFKGTPMEKAPWLED